MLNDPLANALSKIRNSEKLGESSCIIRPISNIIKRILVIMNEKGYIGENSVTEEAKGGKININLLGKINKCGAIKPRFTVKDGQFEFFEKRYLPAKGFGILIVSTNQGIMTHEEAKEKKIGGILLAYCY
ncbi:30S ribosomal protein S8 [Candidatus Woesearchaeota archaeon]|nr:30S ribosomal protein S8 [Candidatus Woesearchaeota archaeon]